MGLYTSTSSLPWCQSGITGEIPTARLPHTNWNTCHHTLSVFLCALYRWIWRLPILPVMSRDAHDDERGAVWGAWWHFAVAVGDVGCNPCLRPQITTYVCDDVEEFRVVVYVFTTASCCEHVMGKMVYVFPLTALRVEESFNPPSRAFIRVRMSPTPLINESDWMEW